MPADPEKPRTRTSENIEYQPKYAERDIGNEAEHAEDPSEHRDREIDAESKENSV